MPSASLQSAKLYLASASPRRLELLRLAGFAPEIVRVDVPEQRGEAETPEQYCTRVALAKAEAGFALLGRPNAAVVLGADTEVVLQDRVFGKPESADDVREMLAALSGKSHAVITAVATFRSGESQVFSHASEVRFKTLSANEINAYIATGEAFGKAGAYAIQGVGACFIAHLQGSHSSVMGLPIFETNALLNRFGVFANWQLFAL
jgi:septum formation protein